MLKPILIEAWELWDGNASKACYKHILAESRADAEAEALEFAFTLLDPYRNDIRHLGNYMAEKYGYDPEEVIHDTMLECVRYELWEKW